MPTYHNDRFSFQWVDQNNIRINVEKEFSLDEAGNALDYQKNVHPRGKVVLDS